MSSPRYDPLPFNEHQANTWSFHESRVPSHRLVSFTTLASFISLIMLIVMGAAISIKVPVAYNCGKSPAEAESRGCVFEEMTFNWVHPACHDEELNEQFIAYRPWPYYGSSAFVNETSQHFVKAGQLETAYTTEEWHHVHCTFVWKKIHRSALAGRPLDDVNLKYLHTEHCARMLLARVPMGRLSVSIEMQFTTCPIQRHIWSAMSGNSIAKGGPGMAATRRGLDNSLST